jgi:hypothetical protein
MVHYKIKKVVIICFSYFLIFCLLDYTPLNIYTLNTYIINDDRLYICIVVQY